MAKYPIFLELGGRRTVVIGAGTVAIRKAQVLLDAGARVVMVAPKLQDIPVPLAKAGKQVEIIKSNYSKEFLTEASLVIAATNDHKLNEQIYKDCQELEIICNVVDSPELCDFFVPAVLKRGDLQIAIGTEGNCPAYAGHLRKKFEEIVTEQHGQFLSELESIRQKVIAEISDADTKKTTMGQLVSDESFDYYIKNGSAAWRDRAEKIIQDHQIQIS